MNYKRHFIEQLKTHTLKIMAQDNLKNRIKDLELRLESPRLANMGGCTTGKDGSRYEETLLNILYEKGNLEKRFRDNEQDIKQIQNAVKILDHEEKNIIEGLYFNNITPERLADTLHTSRTNIYNQRNRAIEKMMLFMFGAK